jgi:hypothetical protein
MGKLFEVHEIEPYGLNNKKYEAAIPPNDLSGFIETMRFLEVKYTPLVDSAESFSRLSNYQSLLNNTEIAKIIEDVTCEMGLIIWNGNQ